MGLTVTETVYPSPVLRRGADLVFCAFIHPAHEVKKLGARRVAALRKINAEIFAENLKTHLHAALIALIAALLSLAAEHGKVFVGILSEIHGVEAAPDIGRRVKGLLCRLGRGIGAPPLSFPQPASRARHSESASTRHAKRRDIFFIL